MEAEPIEDIWLGLNTALARLKYSDWDSLDFAGILAEGWSEWRGRR